MTKPQQPELRRSEKTPELAPDAIAGELNAHDRPRAKGSPPDVPKANQPGSQSGPVQDKPDMDDFIARASGSEDADGSSARSLLQTAGEKITPPVIRTVAVSAGAAVLAAKAVSAILRRMRS